MIECYLIVNGRSDGHVMLPSIPNRGGFVFRPSMITKPHAI